jgi:hypothetical protein
MANWTDFNEDAYLPAMRTAVVWHAVLGVLTSLMLDGGQLRRLWALALVCHLAIVWLILFRRPLAPSRLDLAIVSYSALPLMVIVAAVGPPFLHILGAPPGMNP